MVPLASLHETREAALQLESGDVIDISRATFRAIRHDRHPMRRWVDLVAPNAVRPEKTAIRIPGPAPKYGQDTCRILERLGYNKTEIASKLGNGIVSTEWAGRYLPE